MAHGQVLADQPSLPDVLTVDAVQRASPPPDFRVGTVAGERLLERLKSTLPREPREDLARTVSYIGLLEGLQAAGGEVGQDAGELAGELRHGVDVGDVDRNVGLIEIIESAKDVEAERAARAFDPIAGDLVVADWPGTPVRPPLDVAPSALIELVKPATTLTARIRTRFGQVLPSWLPPDWFDDLFVQPIMAAPVFTRPMYKALDEYSWEWLLPGLAKFPQPDVVTVLVSNARFLEGFLTGLSQR